MKRLLILRNFLHTILLQKVVLVDNQKYLYHRVEVCVCDSIREDETPNTIKVLGIINEYIAARRSVPHRKCFFVYG